MNSFVAEEKNVKIIGRTYTSERVLWMALSGTGIAFTVNASSCTLVLAGDSIATGGEEKDKSRIAIYVNDSLVVDDIIRAEESRYEVFKSENPEKIHVRLIKLSEAPMSVIGVKEILTDAAVITPAQENSLKIEFVGDSITCGYGTDDPDETHGFSTATENIEKAYSFLTAKALNADYSMISYSGYGIISGYTEGERNTAELVPPFYEKVAFTRGRFGRNINLTDIAWNFDRYIPDLVVINLGTNDDSFCKEHEDRQKEYQREYCSFLKVIRRHNPNAILLCILGMMGQRLCPFMEAAVAEYKAETKDEKIYALWMDEQKAENGYSADFHPSVKSHSLAAKQLTAKIKELLKL